MSTYEADPTRFCTPATELVFALAVAGLSGTEASVMLAAIGHCFGPPRWELKGTLLRVSRHWLANALPQARSSTYAAIDNLVRRGLLRTAANKCLIINKRLHEWRDAQDAPLFSPRGTATVNMHTHLARWPWSVELATRVPLGAGPLFSAPEAAELQARAETVPTQKTSGPPDATSGPPDYPPAQNSGPPDYPTGKTSGPPDAFVRPTGLVTPENSANEAPAQPKEKEMTERFDWPDGADPETDRLVTYAATEGRLPAQDRPKLAAMLATCLEQGVDPSTLIAAVEDYVASDKPELLRSALAYIRSRIQQPAKCLHQVRRSYVAWCARRPMQPAAPAKPPAPTQAQLAQQQQSKADQAARENAQRAAADQAAANALAELHAQAAAFTVRPAACHLQVIDELRRAGESLRAIQVDAWRAEGAAPWRNLPDSKRKNWARALAAAEQACRGALAEHLRGGAVLEIVTVRHPRS